MANVSLAKNTAKTAVLAPFVLCGLLGCGAAGAESGEQLKEETVLSTPRSPTPDRQAIPDLSAAELCDRLHTIKRLPYRDPNDTDPIYEALIAKGRDAVPCLIEKIADETPMEDPREAPPWQQYKVGDTAVFILIDIADADKKLIPEMLPTPYKKEWKTNGVYAYFNYVIDPGSRQELQKWWSKWMKENPEGVSKPL
jgi:hypothetical protein